MAEGVESEVSRCAKLFRTAKTDNERLAALFMVSVSCQLFLSADRKPQCCQAILIHTCFTNILYQVTKLVNSENTDRSTRRKLFDVVGFTFINRLLATSKSVN